MVSRSQFQSSKSRRTKKLIKNPEHKTQIGSKGSIQEIVERARSNSNSKKKLPTSGSRVILHMKDNLDQSLSPKLKFKRSKNTKKSRSKEQEYVKSRGKRQQKKVYRVVGEQALTPLLHKGGSISKFPTQLKKSASTNNILNGNIDSKLVLESEKKLKEIQKRAKKTFGEFKDKFEKILGKGFIGRHQTKPNPRAAFNHRQSLKQGRSNWVGKVNPPQNIFRPSLTHIKNLPKIEEDENEIQSPREDSFQQDHQNNKLKKSQSGKIHYYSPTGHLDLRTLNKKDYRYSSHMDLRRNTYMEVRNIVIDEISDNRAEDRNRSRDSRDGIILSSNVNDLKEGKTLDEDSSVKT